MTDAEMQVAIAELKKEVGSAKHRLDDVEQIVQAVHGLALEMARQTEEIKHMNETIHKLNQDMADLKEKPGNRWEQLVGALIGAIAGAAAALFFE